jgi:hypothetical protein
MKSALGVGASDVCFSPNSGAKPDIAGLRLRARSGYMLDETRLSTAIRKSAAFISLA